MQDQAKQLKHERDVARGQLTVLSRQHQETMRGQAKEHQGKLDSALGRSRVLEAEAVEVQRALGDILADAQSAEAVILQVLEQRHNVSVYLSGQQHSVGTCMEPVWSIISSR